MSALIQMSVARVPLHTYNYVHKYVYKNVRITL